MAITTPELTPAAQVRRLTLKQALLTLGLICTLPGALIAAGAVYEDYSLRQERLYQSAIDTARVLAVDLDHEWNSVEAGLLMLAAAPELAQGDLRGFGYRLLDALRLQPVDEYLLLDESGQVVQSTSQDQITIIPAALQKQLRRDNHTVLSDLLPADDGYSVVLGVPAELLGQTGYSIFAVLRARRLNQVLAQRPLKPGWVAAVFDGSSIIAGRSRDAAIYVGQPTVTRLAVATRQRLEGTLETVTKDGVPVLTAFSHPSLGHWSVAVGAPQDELSAALWRSMSIVLLGGLVLFGLGLFLAYRLAQCIERSVSALVAPAEALGRGDRVRVPQTYFRETVELGAALLHASQMLAHTQDLAYHDPLTGLCNRLLFRELAQHAMSSHHGQPLVLLAIDLDHFKQVNDTLGHGAGDLVLTLAAQRMMDTVRANDLVARFGGDEFMILLDGADGERAAYTIERLVEALSLPYPGITVPVGASVGMARYPQDGLDLMSLITAADRDLYRSKHAGRERDNVVVTLE